MAPSGAEVLRQIKNRIDEVDPAFVPERLHSGALLIDVRETRRVGGRATSPARDTFPRATSSRGSRAPRPTAPST